MFSSICFSARYDLPLCPLDLTIAGPAFSIYCSSRHKYRSCCQCCSSLHSHDTNVYRPHRRCARVCSRFHCSCLLLHFAGKFIADVLWQYLLACWVCMRASRRRTHDVRAAIARWTNDWCTNWWRVGWTNTEQSPEGHYTRKRIHFRTDDDGLLCRSFYNVYEYVKIGSNRARAAANMSLQPICATQIGNCGLDLLIIMCTQHFRLPSFWNTFIIILCASNFNAYRIIIFLVATKRSVCDASSSDWTAVFTSSLAMLMVASNQRWIRSRVDASVG